MASSKPAAERVRLKPADPFDLFRPIARAPWSSGRFESVIDFPDLELAPSPRRGFVPNAAAAALIEREADDARDLRRVFRRLPASLPHYALCSLRSPALGDQGVPDPQPVHDPADPWRSRVFEGRWEYDTAHRDDRAVQDDSMRRLRDLVHLFAKEVVQRNFGAPQNAELLERRVEVLTYVGEPTLRKGDPIGRPERAAGSEP